MNLSDINLDKIFEPHKEVETKPAIILNNTQKRSLDILLDWARNPNRPFAVLKGSAGTGKTTVINEFSNHNRFGRHICITAPTHKAKRIVAGMTGLESYTIQSILGLRPNTNIENFDINNPQFDPLGEKKITEYPLFVVDETSMLGPDPVTALKDEAQRYNKKILFVGDSFQLPPIKKDKDYSNKTETNVSPVFTDSQMIQTELTEIVRQSNDNPLTLLLAFLRNDINTFVARTDKTIYGDQARENRKIYFDNLLYVLDLFGYPVIIDKVKQNKDSDNLFLAFLNAHKAIIGKDNTKGYSIVSVDGGKENCRKHFVSEQYDADINFMKYTAWTNDSIGMWNSFIREQMFPDKYQDFLVKGELLMAYNTISDSDDNSVIISNSDDYIVESFEKGESEEGVKGYWVSLSNAGYILNHRIFMVAPEGMETFLEVFHDRLSDAQQFRGRYWQRYYNFRNTHLLKADVRRGKTVVTKKDLDFGAGTTVHKTQGSTYNNVLVNGINISKDPDPLEVKKLWYVAISRAKDFASILY